MDYNVFSRLTLGKSRHGVPCIGVIIEERKRPSWAKPLLPDYDLPLGTLLYSDEFGKNQLTPVVYMNVENKWVLYDEVTYVLNRAKHRRGVEASIYYSAPYLYEYVDDRLIEVF